MERHILSPRSRQLRVSPCAVFVFVAAFALSFSTRTSAQTPHAYQLTGDFWGTHDPSVIKQGSTWYVFATGKAPGGGQFAIRCSTDLTHWRLCGQVFDAIPDWIQKDSPKTVDLWAPDISYDHAEYRLYYAYSLFGKNTSGIALALNKTLNRSSPDYKWIDKGLVLRSIETDDYNAIDPNFVIDGQGRSWLAFGSFWSGIKLRQLNGEGKLSTENTKLYSLAGRKEPADAAAAKPGLPPDWEAIEAPFIFRHGDWFYLFVSWDLCCRGTKSTYRIMAGRSKEITGPYVDESGVAMVDGGGTQILAANRGWLGPGGESLLAGTPDDLIVFHAYNVQTGKPALQVSTIDWSTGWPQIALPVGNTEAPK